MRKQSSTAHLLNMEQNSDKEPQEIVRSKSRLPKDLQKRLLADSIGDSHYKKVSGVDQLNAKSANST
ncbi:MAG: hypothetical protein NTU49_04515, partial [Gammaproteobacteria bacterium]|nr:hypothetical protein [Gammaproteobacteria bacterium]